MNVRRSSQRAGICAGSRSTQWVFFWITVGSSCWYIFRSSKVLQRLFSERAIGADPQAEEQALLRSMKEQGRPSFTVPIHLVTYADSNFAATMSRLLSEANSTGWFKSVTGFTPDDIPASVRSKYADILKFSRGGGFWIWRYPLLELKSREIMGGEYILYLDSAFRFLAQNHETLMKYVKLLQESGKGLLLFESGFYEQELTTEHIFRYFNVSILDDEVRNSQQILGGAQLMRKGADLEDYFASVRLLLDTDPWLITDCYNEEAKRINPEFSDHRHDQSIVSVFHKKKGGLSVPFPRYFSEAAATKLKYPFFVDRYGRETPKNVTKYNAEDQEWCPKDLVSSVSTEEGQNFHLLKTALAKYPNFRVSAKLHASGILTPPLRAAYAFHLQDFPPARCTNPDSGPMQCIEPSSKTWQPEERINLYTCDLQCPAHSTCFLGTCLCHPGYEGESCDKKMAVANPWFVADCPNLQENAESSLNVSLTFEELGGKNGCSVGLDPKVDYGTGLSYCAYLCYSREDSGVAVIPFSIWEAAQRAEGSIWVSARGADNDRYDDHWQGFSDFACLAQNVSLGNVLEVGSGPWTQFNGLLHKRPDVHVDSYSIWEPAAQNYMENVPTCAYSSGKLKKFRQDAFHPFPMHINAHGGEEGMKKGIQYDTVMVCNVIEHVYNAPDFLHSIHFAVKPGGLLIFHDRFFPDPLFGDKVLGQNILHPIRLTQRVFDLFLSDFEIIFNNCDGGETIGGWKKRRANEMGYYLIARKRTS